MGKSLHQILDNIWKYTNNDNKEDKEISLSTYEFIYIFATNHFLFNNNEQQDCIEFLRILFEDLSQE